MSHLQRRHEIAWSQADTLLFEALAASIAGLSRHKARLAVMAGLVQVDGSVTQEPRQTLPGACTLICDLRQGIPAHHAVLRGERPRTEQIPFTILHHDRHIIVVDKAPGVLSAPGESGERGALPELLRRHLRRLGRDPSYLGIVHRLDKDTSGCLVLALDAQARRILGEQFAGSAAGRVYRCLVAPAPHRDAGRIEGRMGHGRDGRRAVVDDDQPGKTAVTRWRVVRRFGELAAELELELETGRTHQIRVHLAELGCPVLGERIYGRRQRLPPPGGVRAARPLLHAQRLELDHPGSGARLRLETPPPADYAEAVTRLEQAVAASSGEATAPATAATAAPLPARRRRPVKPRPGR